MNEYLIRTLLNDIDIDPPKKSSIKYPRPTSDHMILIGIMAPHDGSITVESIM